MRVLSGPNRAPHPPAQTNLVCTPCHDDRKKPTPQNVKGGPVKPQPHPQKGEHQDLYVLLRKEVIQPHLPVRLTCYDFTPIASPTFDGSLPKGWATGFGCCPLSWCDGRCVQGPGTYSPQRC